MALIPTQIANLRREKMNKVKYGLKNCHYALLTEGADRSVTYATPAPIPGAVSLSMDAQGDVTRFRADNTDYWVGRANNGYSGTLEMALIPESFKIDVLGYMETTGGMLVEDSEATPKPFALLFQFDGDESATRRIFYNCTVSRPGVSGQTTDTTITPQTESMSLETATIYNAAADTTISYAEANADSSEYANFFSSVVQPSAYSDSEARLTGITIGSSALDPAFAPRTTSYRCTTANATDVVSATGDMGVTAAITVNGTAHTSGNSATWNSGTNVVIVTTSGTDLTSKTYVVIVTKTSS